jgi:hypothetical protein
LSSSVSSPSSSTSPAFVYIIYFVLSAFFCSSRSLTTKIDWTLHEMLWLHLWLNVASDCWIALSRYISKFSIWGLFIGGTVVRGIVKVKVNKFKD